MAIDKTQHHRKIIRGSPTGGGFHNICGLCKQRWPCQAEQDRRKLEPPKRKYPKWDNAFPRNDGDYPK